MYSDPIESSLDNAWRLAMRDPSSYRSDIDGLRAVAVIGVVIYHADFSINQVPIFGGGYIGVDVFFVISGFLITRIILRDLFEKEKFDIYMFYMRRARRIIPALVVVTVASAVIAWSKLLPEDFRAFTDSSGAALLFYSNFLFYFTSTQYGADSSLTEPLLHTWSLSVEEQF